MPSTAGGSLNVCMWRTYISGRYIYIVYILYIFLNSSSHNHGSVENGCISNISFLSFRGPIFHWTMGVFGYQPESMPTAGLWSWSTLDWQHGSMDTSLKINILRLLVPKCCRLILVMLAALFIDDAEKYRAEFWQLDAAEWMMARYFALHGTGNDDQWQVQSST